MTQNELLLTVANQEDGWRTTVVNNRCLIENDATAITILGIITPPAGGGAGNLEDSLTGNIEFAPEVNHIITVEDSVTSNTAGGNLSINSADGVGTGAGGTFALSSGAGGATGAGGPVTITTGAGGSTSGASGALTLATGSTTSGNSGLISIAPGTSTGGKNGAIALRASVLKKQSAPTAKTATDPITAAQLVTGIITTTGVTGPSVHQLPTGTLLLAEFPGAVANDSFDFYVINTGTGAATDATITVNTDVTIVGNPTVGSLVDATQDVGSGHFRARYTGGVTWVVYRLA